MEKISLSGMKLKIFEERIWMPVNAYGFFTDSKFRIKLFSSISILLNFSCLCRTKLARWLLLWALIISAKSISKRMSLLITINVESLIYDAIFLTAPPVSKISGSKIVLIFAWKVFVFI